jgi:hypothetical protein
MEDGVVQPRIVCGKYLGRSTLDHPRSFGRHLVCEDRPGHAGACGSAAIAFTDEGFAAFEAGDLRYRTLAHG